MRKLLAKHPRIFKNYIENKEEETLHCDNKSISFQDYLKKRNSLADDERVEKLNLQKNSNELCYQENDYNQDSFSNIMTKKHSQNKMATINFKNTTNRKPEATILSRKISLPNEIAHKPGKIDDEKNNQISTEKSTVKNKNNLNIALQAYFPHKPIEKTPSFKNITEKTNDYQLKTPQHNNEKKKALGCPYKRVINLNLNLENSYFQENSQISQNQQTKNNFPYNNSSRINTCEQEEDSANPSKLYSRLRQLKLSNHQAKEEKKNITDIKPVFSISPKYVSQHYTPFSKAQNKENLSYLANRNQQLKSKILQEEAKEKKDDSLHEINISFDEFSKKKSKENKKEEQKLKESTKRSISVHISSKADLDNLVNPVNNFSDFADFLRKKEEEKKKHQESFISFLEKKQIQEYTKKNDSFLQSQKKQDFLKQILLKMLGEKKFSLLLNILSNFEKNGEKQIEKADLSELEEFIGECDKGVILMLQDMYKIANQNDQKLNRMSTSLLLD